MMDQYNYSQILQDAPIGYAYHRIICDAKGNPVDYVFLEVNPAYEKATGLKGTDIIGSTLSSALKEVFQKERQWVEIYGDIALNGGRKAFERYSDSLRRWFKVTAYSPQREYFVTMVEDITVEKSQLNETRRIVELSEEFLQADTEKIDNHKIAQDFLRICDAKYVTFNLIEDDGYHIKTVGIAAERGMLKKATELLGFQVLGRRWEPNSIYLEKIRQSTITHFDSINSLAGNVLSEKLARVLEKVFNVGDIYAVIIEKNGALIGYFNIFIEAGKTFHRETLAKLYTRQLGMVIMRRKLEAELLQEKVLLETTLISVGDAVISTDKDGKVVLLNRIAEKLTGWTHEEAIGKPMDTVFNIINEYTREKCENIVDKVLKSGRTSELANHTVLVSRDGTERPIEDSAAPIIYPDGRVDGVVLVFRDFSEKKQKQEEIAFLSYHDQLTGLYNRRFYEDEIVRLDTPRNLPMSLVLGDVNGLKLINDSFGHAMGDELLKKTAEILRSGCGSDALIARLGGDEFVIILKRTDTAGAEAVVRRIAALAAREHVNATNISISFGMGTKKSQDESIQEVFKLTENMMYQHKLSESLSMRSRTIDLIINTLFEKNEREMQHSKRVSQLCGTIAEKLHFAKDEVNQIKLAGLMHDIGKIGVDENILNKRGKLTEEEWQSVRRHSEIGYRILSSVNEFSEIANYVLEHHEKWNGQGYPRGLRGEEVSLKSRIIALADAFDAMTSLRTYKAPLSLEQAVEEIQRCSGTQFDPIIVKVFVEEVLKEERERLDGM